MLHLRCSEIVQVLTTGAERVRMLPYLPLPGKCIPSSKSIDSQARDKEACSVMKHAGRLLTWWCPCQKWLATGWSAAVCP